MIFAVDSGYGPEAVYNCDEMGLTIVPRPVKVIAAKGTKQVGSIWPWNYFRSIPAYEITLPERHGQTDGQTTYCRISALCVPLRGKNGNNW